MNPPETQCPMTEVSHKTDLLCMTLEQLTAFVSTLGLKAFRGGQIFQWIYRHGKTSFQEMTNIAGTDQQVLEESSAMEIPELAERLTAADGTEKYLYRMGDGLCVEGVLIPESKRVTLCISTQAGCAMGCEFCLTTQGGLYRNLTTGEIVGQVLLVRQLLGESQPLTHLVLMGMGEPLANYDNTLRALKILLDPHGFDFSSRKVTLSTAGLIPGIRRLLEENVGIGLAVSLNASDSKTRDRLMPINRTYPMEDLLETLRTVPIPKRRRITFEYVLISGMNDGVEDAKRLACILRGIPCKINLIPYNPIPGISLTAPSEDRIAHFQQTLYGAGYTVFIRESRGQEILAACGQLGERFVS